MSSVFFTSDIHLGHRLAARLRGFSELADHDEMVLSKVSIGLNRRSKLYILGDVCFGRDLSRLNEIPGIKAIVLGNHDREKARKYLDVESVVDVHGALQYKRFLATHVPIHPQELTRFRANIHGHIHVGGATQNPVELYGCGLRMPNRYINVGVEWNGFRAVPFETIVEKFTEEPRVY